MGLGLGLGLGLGPRPLTLGLLVEAELVQLRAQLDPSLPFVLDALGDGELE